jgi:penicillin-binding protein 1A
MAKKKTKKGYRIYIIGLWATVAFFVTAVIGVFALAAFGFFGEMPSFEQLENPKSQLATEVYSAEGILLGKYYFQNRSIASFEEIPPLLKNTLLATEDIRFYDHSGIDYLGTLRAIISTAMGDKEGASTITQQLAKNLFPRPKERTLRTVLTAKLKEWIISVKLERRYTKDEIINLYLNTVEFSENSFGIKSAARTYFNKVPDSLKVEEAAVLIGMLKGSTLYNPRRNPGLALSRRNTVLDQMAKYKFLPPNVVDSIKNLPIRLNYVSPDHNEGHATYFREFLRQELLKWCKENTKPDGSNYNLYTDGLKVYTTINYKMQRYAEQAVNKHMHELQDQFFKSYKNKPPWGDNDDFIETAMKQCDRYIKMKKRGISADSIKKVFHTPIPMTVYSYKGDLDTLMSPWDSIKYYKMFLHTGFMVMDPFTGNILAWVGGINHRYFQYDHVNVRAKRQVGSTIKPILYALAIENGYSPCYTVPNQKVVFENFNNWSPDNSDNKYGGMLTLYQGLAGSVNTISAYLMKQLGPKPMIDLARRMGITSNMEPYPSICLGTPDISVYEMTGAYSTFVNHGVYTKPQYITRITDNQGTLIQELQSKQVEVINEQVAYIMCRMLQNVVDYGTARRMRFKYNLKGELGGKTGTTQSNTDGWFMGITPQLCGGCWVGGEDRIIRFRSMQFGQGAAMALPIWAYFLQYVYADKSLGITPDAHFQRPLEMSIETDCDKYNKGGTTNNLIFGEE